MNEDLAKLRKSFDGDEGFMSAHQIKKIRGRDRKIPEWALNDKEVRKLLLRCFPTLKTNQTRAERAGRWMRVIHLYYRMGLTNSQTAAEMGVSVCVVKHIVQCMTFAFKGLRARDGKPRTPKRPLS